MSIENFKNHEHDVEGTCVPLVQVEPRSSRKQTLSNNHVSLSQLENIVRKLENVTDKLARTSFADSYEEFGKYIASLLRGLPKKDVNSLKAEILNSVLKALSLKKEKQFESFSLNSTKEHKNSVQKKLSRRLKRNISAVETSTPPSSTSTETTSSSLQLLRKETNIASHKQFYSVYNNNLTKNKKITPTYENTSNSCLNNNLCTSVTLLSGNIDGKRSVPLKPVPDTTEITDNSSPLSSCHMVIPLGLDNACDPNTTTTLTDHQDVLQLLEGANVTNKNTSQKYNKSMNGSININEIYLVTEQSKEEKLLPSTSDLEYPILTEMCEPLENSAFLINDHSLSKPTRCAQKILNTSSANIFIPPLGTGINSTFSKKQLERGADLLMKDSKTISSSDTNDVAVAKLYNTVGHRKKIYKYFIPIKPPLKTYNNFKKKKTESQSVFNAISPCPAKNNTVTSQPSMKDGTPGNLTLASTPAKNNAVTLRLFIKEGVPPNLTLTSTPAENDAVTLQPSTKEGTPKNLSVISTPAENNAVTLQTSIKESTTRNLTLTCTPAENNPTSNSPEKCLLDIESDVTSESNVPDEHYTSKDFIIKEMEFKHEEEEDICDSNQSDSLITDEVTIKEENIFETIFCGDSHLEFKEEIDDEAEIYGDLSSTSVADTIIPDTEIDCNLFTCCHCSKTFCDQNLLIGHITTEHQKIMPNGIKQERKKKKLWGVSQMASAIAAVRGNVMGYKKASREFQVPKGSLFRLVKLKEADAVIAASTRLGRKPVFSKSMEEELVKYLIEKGVCSKRCTKQVICTLAFKFAVEKNIAHCFRGKNMAGAHWYKCFMKRNRDKIFKVKKLYKEEEES